MKSRKLILLTSEFPFGYGEPFLETEILFLAKAFDSVVILSNHTKRTDVVRDVPSNCDVMRLELELSLKEKIRAYFGLFGQEYKKEKKYLSEELKIPMSRGIRNTMLVSLFRAKKIKKHLLKILSGDDLLSVVCYSYWFSDNAHGLAMLRDEFPGVKVVSRVHGWDLYLETSETNYLPFRKKITQSLSNVFPISELGFRYMEKRWFVNMNDVIVKRLGTSGRRGVIAPKEEIIILSCSNIIPLKRVDLIAGALSLISDIELTWVHFGDGPELDKLNSIVQTIPSNINVSLMGSTPNTDVLDWYENNRPDLFINVSTTEGVPVSIMEAMSFGVPVIATDVGGTSEIVNVSNGYLVDSNISKDELARKIRYFFDQTVQDRELKGKAAFETWNNKYNARKNYTDFVHCLLN